MSDGLVGIDPDGLRSLAAAGRSGSTGFGAVRTRVAEIAADGVLDNPVDGSLDLLAGALTGLADLCDTRVGELEAIVPWDLDATPTDAEMFAFLDAGGGTGGLVFSLFDGANQGDLGEADGNWSTDDVEAARDPAVVRRMLEEQAAEDGVVPDPVYVETVVALTTGIADQLDVDEEAWEDLDDDIGWYETGAVGWVGDNWQAVIPPQVRVTGDWLYDRAVDAAESYLEWSMRQAQADQPGAVTLEDRLLRAQMTALCGLGIGPSGRVNPGSAIVTFDRIGRILAGERHGGLEDCAVENVLLGD